MADHFGETSGSAPRPSQLDSEAALMARIAEVKKFEASEILGLWMRLNALGMADAAVFRGDSALGLACFHHDANLVRALVEAGASPSGGNEGLAPVHMAIAGARALGKHNGWLSLDKMQACIAALGLQAGDFETRDARGRGALHACCEELGWASAARLLLDLGARVDDVDGEGWMPAHRAALGGDVEIISLLLGAGANPLQKTKPSDSSLMAKSALEIARMSGRNGVAMAIEMWLADAEAKQLGLSAQDGRASLQSPRL